MHFQTSKHFSRNYSFFFTHSIFVCAITNKFHSFKAHTLSFTSLSEEVFFWESNLLCVFVLFQLLYHFYFSFNSFFYYSFQVAYHMMNNIELLSIPFLIDNSLIVLLLAPHDAVQFL